MSERVHSKQLFIPGSFDILHQDHRRFIEAGINAGSDAVDLEKVVIGLVPDKALSSKGRYRPFYTQRWRQMDINEWYQTGQMTPELEFGEFSPRDLLTKPITEQSKYRLAILSTEYRGSRIAQAAQNAADEILYIPPFNTSHTTDIENTLRGARDASQCDWRVGAVLLREGEIIDTAHNGGIKPDSCNSCSKRIDLFRIEQTTGELQPSPIPCDYLHAEAKALENAKRGDHLLTTTSPCAECAEAIVESGVERVVYLRPYHRGDEPVKYLEENGVQVRQAGYQQTK